MRTRLSMLVVLLLFTGCADTTCEPAPVEARVGKNCIVYFRRDALGVGADGPSLTQAGELMAVGDDWIVINLHGREFHIPQTSILRIEFGNIITQSPGLSEPLQPAPADHGDHTTH